MFFVILLASIAMIVYVIILFATSKIGEIPIMYWLGFLAAIGIVPFMV